MVPLCDLCGGTGELPYFRGKSRFLLSRRGCPVCDGQGVVTGDDQRRSRMIELLRARRSVRRFTEEPVSGSDREVLEEAALRSPSSRGLNPWQFVWVDRPELLSERYTKRLQTMQTSGSYYIAYYSVPSDAVRGLYPNIEVTRDKVVASMPWSPEAYYMLIPSLLC